MRDIDTLYVRRALGIPAHCQDFTARVDRDATEFHGTTCDECDQIAAVHVEYAVDDRDENSYTRTDATLCTQHASDGLRCILDREDISLDHGIDVTVNYWAIAYNAIGTDQAGQVAA